MRSFSFSQSSSHVALLSLAASLGLASVSYAAPAPATPAEIVSVQLPPSYYGNYDELASGAAAGVAPYHVANWNVLNTSYSRDTGDSFPGGLTRTQADLYSPFVTSTGSAVSSLTGFTLAFNRNESKGAYDSDIPSNPPGSANFPDPTASDSDYDIATATNFSTSSTAVSLDLMGLHASDSYDLIAYVAAPFYADNVQTTVSLTDDSSTPSSAAITTSKDIGFFQQANAADSFVGNYVEFDNLTGNTDVTLSIPGGVAAGFGGFQLIDNGAPAATGVPEPTSLGLLAIGGMALVKRRRRV